MTIKTIPNALSDDRRRFFEAAYSGQLKKVIELSKKFGDDVNVLSEALTESCRAGHLDVVKWLTKNTDSYVNYRPRNAEEEELWRYTPLSAACRHDHLDVVKYLVETCHADINLTDWEHYTPLTWACRNIKMSMSIYLLRQSSEHDINRTIPKSDGNTALHYAVWYSEYDETELHKACKRHDDDHDDDDDVTEVLRLVYVRGHNINVQDNYGNTPLHYACLHRKKYIVETLVSVEADESITNDERETPAQLAERYGHIELLKLLDRIMLMQEMLKQQKKKSRKRNIICSNWRQELKKVG